MSPHESRLILYTTEHCHLCEEALEIFQAIEPVLVKKGVSLKLKKVDISESAALVDQFGVRIPVFCFRDKEIGWPFSAEDLLHFLI